MIETRKLLSCIEERVEKMVDAAGREVAFIRDDAVRIAADALNLPMRTVYIEAMRQGVLPRRYLRNGNSLSLQDQLKLAESHAAVIGAGGLGGYVIIILAKIGIGCLTVIDHDVFDETNLNRQALCVGSVLGQAKSAVAASAVADINPAVEVKSHFLKLDAGNARELLDGCDVMVDALDNIPDRFVLQNAAESMRVPLVHGAVAGFEGQLMVIRPGEPGLKTLFGEDRTSSASMSSPEAVMGVPAVAPAVIGSLQALEVIKILLGRGENASGTMVHLDMEFGRISRFAL
jgi:molybdopterin-synthase adenylyltransferase